MMPFAQTQTRQELPDRGPLSSATWQVVLFYAIMFALSVGIAWWRGYLERWQGEGPAWIPGAVGIGTGIVIVIVSRLSMHIKAFEWLSEAFSELLHGTSDWQVALFAVLSGLGEEALFRGVLQNEFGILVATLAFGALHVGPSRRYLVWTGFALVVGFLLGMLYLKTGSLVSSVFAHATINLFNLRYLARYQARRHEASSARAGEGTNEAWLREDTARDSNPLGE